MATIRTIEGRRGIVYQALIRRRGKALTRTFRTKSDADRWAKKTEAEIVASVAGLIWPGQSKTLKEAIAKYRAEILPTKEHGTRVAYSGHLDYWETALGTRRLVDLNGQVIARCRDELSTENVAAPAKPGDGEKVPPPKFRSPTTVNRYLATLGSLITAVVKQWHWLPGSYMPLKEVQKLKQPGGRTRFLTEDELRALLAECRASRAPELYLAVLLSVTTGGRQSEIMGIRWENIDFKNSVIHVPKTKNGDARALPIVEEALELLKVRREDGGVVKAAGLVFPSRTSSRKPVLLRLAFLGALKRAGITNFRWHDLRHSAASFLAMAGASLPEIGAVLGHRSQQTTKRYSHLAQTHTHNLVHTTMARVLGRKTDGQPP